MSVLVHLVRHGAHAELGAVLSGRSEIGLSAEGRDQATRLAERVAALAPVAVHSGPRRRARETAELLAAPLGLPVVAEPALDEIDFGDWTGRAFADLAGDPAWTRWNEARGTALPPNGEGMADATARAVAAIERIAAAATGPVVLVSHCDVIRGAVAHYLGLPLDRLLGFDVDPASLSTLSVGAWGGQLVCLNERAS